MKYLAVFTVAVAGLLFAGCQTTPIRPATVSTAPAQPEAHSPAPPAAPQPAAKPDEVKPTNLPQEITLFDGNSLAGWANIETGGNGGTELKDGLMKIGMGADLSGAVWTNASVLPRSNYEIELSALKEQGTDFFCGLTFPVKDSHCSLILGGWGGSIVGLSSLDGMDASENDTSRNMYFEKNKWFQIKVRVTDQNIQAWIDDQKVIDVGIEGRKVSLRFGDIERCKPLGLSTWQTAAAYKNIKLRRL